MKIKDVLTIDLSEEIKNVIDLEDYSEAEIQSEIENYIVTDGLAKEYEHFVTTFTSNRVETGVWISGFYGSGKSYFGKILGYMLTNKKLGGTPARDRVLQRFTGIKDDVLIKNALGKLASENCHVVFLDVAKQDTSKGLAFTLFRNFLRSLDLPENEHGALLFQLMITDKTPSANKYIQQHLSKNWGDIKSRLVEYAKAIKAVYLLKENNDNDYENVMTTIRRDIDQFSASRLREELDNYLRINPKIKIIFLFDEASEAINQQKFSLLDLEGISEALSALGGKVWTIAIAQEKLDDVINNSNIDKAQLTKVTDRFKTKIHLEATEVDIIIQNRLLAKKKDALKKLTDHYHKNSGRITDHAALNGVGVSKTDTLVSYLTYYPFYKHQFSLLQNFLFGSKGLTSTKVAARGMIITAFDVLKRELQERSLFEVATGWQITHQAQPQPPVRLVNRYDNAERILKENGSTVSGRKLLETINFLYESEAAPSSLSNIIKSFISDPEEYHHIQAAIEGALKILVESKVLIFTNNTYRITTDIEQRLLDEMIGFTVQGYEKKKAIVSAYKSSQFIKTLVRINDNNLPYDFYITTDNDDELTNPALKQLKIKLKSIYNLSDNRSADIDALRNQHQNDKDLIWLVPDNSDFREIDKLVDEIKRIDYLEQNYQNPNQEEALILRTFSNLKTEKENRLADLIERSLQEATAIYLYNTILLNKNNWQTSLQGQQRQVIQNVYSKRMSSQLSDTIAASVIKEANAARLHTFFQGPDFLFFDNHGNFIGDHLKVVDEVNLKIRNTFLDGATLEKDLEQPPTGFTFGTVISTMAALMRAGKVVAKYSGAEKFSWRDPGVVSIFSAAREFRKASFKAIAKSLTAQHKNDIVTILHELNCDDHINRKIDWNTTDFDLATAVRELARYYCDKADFLLHQNKDFIALFADLETHKNHLMQYTGAVSEANYIQKAEDLLADPDGYKSAIKAIEKIDKFVKDKYPKLIAWKNFAKGVAEELSKAAQADYGISSLLVEFDKQWASNIVDSYADIQKIIQKIKDEYYHLMQNAATIMAEKYKKLKETAVVLLTDIDALPQGLNQAAESTAEAIKDYASRRTYDQVDLDFDVKDKHSRFTYSEILSFIDIFNSKKAELDIARAGLVKEAPPETRYSSVNPKMIRTQLPSGVIKVRLYKEWLHEELYKVASAQDDDEISLDHNK